MKKLKRYQLKKEYDNSPKLNSIVEECYSVPGQFVDQQSSKRQCYFPPFDLQYWERLEDKCVFIIN